MEIELKFNPPMHHGHRGLKGLIYGDLQAMPKKADQALVLDLEDLP